MARRIRFKKRRFSKRRISKKIKRKVKRKSYKKFSRKVKGVINRFAEQKYIVKGASGDRNVVLTPVDNLEDATCSIGQTE